MTNNTEYTFNSNTGPFLVEFERLLMSKDDKTYIQYKIIGSTFKLFFGASTNLDGTHFVTLSLLTEDGKHIPDPKCIQKSAMFGTRSAKEILAANGFCLIYSKPRIQDLI
jgi:hypothetical protein